MIWANQLPQLPAPRLTAFNTGMGWQSTAILILLKTQPEVFTRAGLALPTVAMWADTGAECTQTHRHVQHLQEWGMPIPLVVVQAKRHGGLPSQAGRPPWFLVGAGGKKGQAIRSCTGRWKAEPLEAALRQYAGFKKGKRVPPGSIHVWMGISEDEIQRAKDHPKPAFVNLYPLLEIGWDRQRCIQLVRDTLTWRVPKSACFFCPYRSPAQWSLFKLEDPGDFSKAILYDAALRESAHGLSAVPYLHVRRKPLAEAVASWEMERAGREVVNGVPLFDDYDPLDNECSGLCGL